MNATSDAAVSLERAVLHLAERGDRRGVIRLVERWAEQGRPTHPALVAEADAFLSLQLMDRAWLRLKEAAEREPDDLAVLALTAKMFIERGWPVRARKVLTRALAIEPANTDLHKLLTQAHQPPLQPPANAREIERSGSPAAQVELAERFLCAGSRLRAKGILERLRRAPGPLRGRVEDLLWGLQSDFGAEEDDPLQLARRLVPHLDRLVAGEEDEEPFYDPDEVTSTGKAGPAGEEATPFPSLFRRVAEDETLDAFTDEEVTAVSRMGDPEELKRFVPEEHTDPDLGEYEEAGDTQIMMVIRQEGGGGSEEDAPPLEDPDTQTFDLKALRRLKAPPPRASDASDLDDDDDDDEFLEEEDEDLIVMTRREAPAKPTEPAPPPPSDKPIEVVEKYPEPTHPPPERPAPRPTPRPAQGLGLDASDDELDFTPPAQRAALRLGAVVGVLGLGAIILGWGWSTFQSTLTSQDVEEALARGSFRALQEGEARFEQRVADDPTAAELAGLAHIQLVLWAEYTGDTERLRSAESHLDAARELSPGAVELPTAWRALYLGDLEAAEAAADKLGRGSEAHLLRARLAAERGDRAASVERVWAALEREPERPRSLATLARACDDAGDADCASSALRALSELHSDDPGFQLLSLELGDLEPEQALAQTDALLAGYPNIAPREAGRAHNLRSRLFDRMGQADQAQAAMEQAISADPGDPGNLYLLAAWSLDAGRVDEALSHLERCVESRPRAWAYQSARLWTLLEMDRVDDAKALVDQTAESLRSDPRSPLLPAALALWGDDDPDAALAALEGLPASDPLVAWVRGSAEGAREDADRAEAAQLLLAAAEGLADHPDPFARLLAPRALAAAALYSPFQKAESLIAELEASAPTDPGVWVLMGNWAELNQERDRAARFFERAVALGDGVARVHYARGLFYMDPSDNYAMTKASWKRYMSLDPSGPRADRVRQQGLY